MSDDHLELRADVHLGACLAHPASQDPRHQAFNKAAKHPKISR